MLEGTEYQLSKDETCDACPLSFLEKEFSQYMRYYNLFITHGLLPESGGILDQQNLFIEFCEIVDNVKSKVEKEESERANRKNNKR